MSRTGVAALVVLCALRPAAARSQRPAAGDVETRARAARADALAAQIAREDSLVRLARYQDLRARRFDAGDVTVLLSNAVGEATGRRIAEGAAAYLDSSGIPTRFVASVVVVAALATARDSVIRAERLAGRARVTVDVLAKPDSLADGWPVAAAVARAYVASLDPEWRAWLPGDAGIMWKRGREDVAAVRSLAAGETRAAVDCLGGRPAACRLWLGLDRDADPYAVRYTAEDIRAFLRRLPYFSYGSDWSRCRDGADDACLRFARTSAMPATPAGPLGARSLLRAVRAVHGADAVGRAFSDTSGSIGERLARSAGISEDSLVVEWRAWLLTGGAKSTVTASGRDAVPVLVFGGLLLLAAARSGRWR